MITKTVFEKIFRYHEFHRSDGNGWLNESENITVLGSVKCYEKDAGTETTSTMISDTSIYASTKVRYKVKAGTAGKIYIIKIQITSSNGQDFEDWLYLAVK